MNKCLRICFGVVSIWLLFTVVTLSKREDRQVIEVKQSDSETNISMIPLEKLEQKYKNCMAQGIQPINDMDLEMASFEGWDLPEEEIAVLERIVEAEAEGEDTEGKILVANVVLNRVRDEDFPDTVKEVVFQKVNGVTQFSPVSGGRYERVTISEDSVEAVERALNGEDLSEGALYFAARKAADPKAMKWFDENLTFLFKHGGHEFYK